MRQSHDVLEIGPGTGLYTMPLAGACRSVVAVDSSSAMVRFLTESAAAAGIVNVTPVEGCATELASDGPPYDGFLAAGVFNYLPDLPPVLTALTTRLKPGGWAVFSVPLTGFGGRIYRVSERLSGHRIWTYSPEQITEISHGAGLEVRGLSRAGVSRAGMTLVEEASRR